MSNSVLVIAGYFATGFVGLMGPTLAGRFTRRNAQADRIHNAQIEAAVQAMECVQIISDRIEYHSYDRFEVGNRPVPPRVPGTHAIQARLELVLPDCAPPFAMAVRSYRDTMAWATENMNDPDEQLPSGMQRAMEQAVEGAADSLRSAVTSPDPRMVRNRRRRWRVQRR